MRVMEPRVRVAGYRAVLPCCSNGIVVSEASEGASAPGWRRLWIIAAAVLLGAAAMMITRARPSTFTRA
ncbi:hypothetical protein [Kibdelosporangium aridum]|uniref:Uncharacterized protein n=1 Tax=Kibdelosporangium aridum TaxID=2030 RepID=A0A1W2B1N9_KIBAR|nr:hypothetical protein [Kibdelosporangium aridum]SMC66641.1 hypothetical protein SAMN05661093_01310 [Kibdelosporangium aridum]